VHSVNKAIDTKPAASKNKALKTQCFQGFFDEIIPLQKGRLLGSALPAAPHPVAFF
jgi:hypothetical protein